MSFLQSTMTKAQALGKALMLPIALLPAAGLLLGIGNALGLSMMEAAGGVIFGNLALLFAVGVAVGLTKDSGAAALAAIAGLLVMNQTISVTMGITPDMVAEGRYASVLGIPTLQTGPLGGMLVGMLAAYLYNRFYNIQLPEFLGFFAGKRFVPIVTAFSAFLLGLAVPLFWPAVQDGIAAVSTSLSQSNMYVSTFFYGFMERALIPVGLHHVFYAPYWFTFFEYTAGNGEIVNGAQTIWWRMFADGVHSFEGGGYDNAGAYISGNFAIYMFAFPAACLAMYQEAHTKNKKIAAGLLGSAALTAFVTGITEPVEFAFVFVAPVLYFFNAIMAGVSYSVSYALDLQMGKTFSAGIIDYVLYGVMPSLSGFETNWAKLFLWGPINAAIYYSVFRVVIRKFNYQTVGREQDMTEITLDDESLAREILRHVGGSANLKTIGSCITRLRLEVTDMSLVNSDAIRQLGAMGVVKVGSHGVQIILGAKAQFIANLIERPASELAQA
ncbi:PTS transporter subunit EIIC [Vibrio genomosp. F10]|uniref:PTS N-acetylglucosamine transporter subunit IICB n=1 Tax=Vibrio genomosp. F10 TaxID=723171 RepID=A0A1B9QWK7_9VIBR|nr:PTS transporter subunit EIIC [Vibrio genomosp. F10]OCH73997.1 PTS N-acetylglucosamine transporter subunit IICB [Vibrio genomosp. F10]